MFRYALKVFGAALGLYIVAENWSGATNFLTASAKGVASIPGAFKVTSTG